MGRVDGKVALITGGARGMGAEHARLLVSEGAKVVIGDVLDDEGHAVARQLGDNGHYLRLDVTQPEQWTSAVAETVRRFGHLNVLVNNAGVAGRKTLRKFELERWRHTLDVNLTGTFLGTQAVVDEMIGSGGGSIVNISSIEGLRGAPFAHAYVASKWAVRGLTKSTAIELGRYNIRVNSVHPGLVRTSMTAHFPDDIVAAPLGRPGEPIEVSNLVSIWPATNPPTQRARSSSSTAESPLTPPGKIWSPSNLRRTVGPGCGKPRGVRELWHAATARFGQAKGFSVSDKTPDDIFKLAKDEHIEYVDVRFCDLPGTMQHFTIPIYVFDETVFEEGLAFDGSSIRGFQSIHESDMLLLPDPETATIDPFRAAKTLIVNFSVHDPFTLELYSRDPRNVARKAENYLISSGIADTAYFGPEAEFYIFDSVKFDSRTNESFYKVDATSGWWNTGAASEADGSPNLGHKVRPKGGYFPVAPSDHYVDLRDIMLTHLTNAGFSLEKGHHEVGSGGQAEINYKFNTLLHAADDHQMYKYIIKQTAWQVGKSVTFMPKPLFGDNGSGMHCHQSLWKDGVPLMYDQTGYAGLSEIARHYIGGLLYHAPSLLAFTNPTVNSYKRLVPGYEAPINLVYSQRNRSACVRIPITGNNPKAKRLEFRCPDASGNPYLSFSAMLMAGLDGIKNKIEPPPPIDKDLYDLPPEEAADIPQAPTQLSAVIDRLEDDHEYLTEGGVFTPDLIATWISYKRDYELAPYNLHPTPYEFALYYDV